jgi:hypothetical protein
MAPLSIGWSMSPTSSTRGDARGRRSGVTDEPIRLRAEASPTTRNQGIPMKLSIKVGGRLMTATLADSTSARDFASLLPMTLTLSDHASIEKVSDLPRRLATECAPEGITPSVGDTTYYAP